MNAYKRLKINHCIYETNYRVGRDGSNRVENSNRNRKTLKREQRMDVQIYTYSLRNAQHRHSMIILNLHRVR